MIPNRLIRREMQKMVAAVKGEGSGPAAFNYL